MKGGGGMDWYQSETPVFLSLAATIWKKKKLMNLINSICRVLHKHTCTHTQKS